MIITKLVGGLGNQLFEYSIGRRIADKLGTDLLIDNMYYTMVNPRHQYALSLLNIRSYSPADDEVFPPIHAYVEKTMDYDPDVLEVRDNCALLGYWQNYNYVEPIRDMLRREVVPLNALSGLAGEAYNHIRTNPKKKVCIHFRGTDFTTWTKFNVVDKEYYRRAIELLVSKLGMDITLYIFSDDMEASRQVLGGILPPVEIKAPSFNQVEDLYLMSLCDAFIIPNSTYSWWGSFLSKAEDKLIIAPSRWWTEASDLTDMERSRNLITPEMTLIEN
jgi:hypothetical protein